MISIMVNDPLSRIPVGGVQLFFCTDVDETIHTFALGKATATDKALTVVVQPWVVLPDQEQLITGVIHNLAEIALATWPGWYGQATTTPLTIYANHIIEIGDRQADALNAQTGDHRVGQWRKAATQGDSFTIVWFHSDKTACHARVDVQLLGGLVDTGAQQQRGAGCGILEGALPATRRRQDNRRGACHWRGTGF